ncbi:MAG TPA: hypothetical protein VFC35_10780 [Gemmatimonadaceae bacterium]|nr:hypothetical protein [Gemmatimonadaceae bacterium]
MPPLSTRHIQDSRSVGQSQNVDYASGFTAISLEREDGLVLEKVSGIEIRLPPFR